MGHSQSSLSSGEKKAAIAGSVLLLILVAFGVARAQSSGTASTSSPPSPPEATATPAATSTDDLENQKRQIKDSLDYAKRLRTELERIKKDVPELDISVALEQVSKYESCLNAVQPGVADFWGVLSPCSDYSRNVEDELNDRLRPIQYCKDLSKGIKDRKRERKNLDRDLKDILRQDKTADVSGIQNLLGQIDTLLAKAEPFLQCASIDDRDGLEDIGKDIGDLFNDFYSAKQEVWDKANLTQRRTDNRKDFEKNLKRQCEKDQAREMKNLEKDYAKAEKAGQLTDADRANFTAAKDNYTAVCVTQLNAMKQALDADDMDVFEDARNEYHNLNQDFWNLVQAAREGFSVKQQLKDVTRDLNQKKKDIANMRKEYDRNVKKSGAHNAETEAILKEIESTVAQAEEAVKTDPQSWWGDYQQTINDLQNRFWEINQKAQNVVNTERWLKDLERDLKFREQELKRMKRNKEFEDASIYEKLGGIISRMKEIMAKAREVLASDPDAANDTLQEYDELRFEWDETTRSMWERNQIKFEIENVLREIEHFLNETPRFVEEGKITQNQADACSDFLNGVVSDLKNIKLEPGQTVEDALGGLEDEAREACPHFDEIGDAPPPDEAYYREFIGENVRGIDQDVGAAVLEKISTEVISKVLQKLMTDPNVQNLLQVAGDKYKDAAAAALEGAETFYEDESLQRELISRKTQLLELNKQIEELTEKVQAYKDQLAAVQNEIANYNFYGNSGDAIQREMQVCAELLQGGGKEQARQCVERLRAKKDEAIAASKRAKFEDKIIPFLDTDDNFWGTKFVAPLAKLGVVQGKGEGHFDPGAQVTVAELITMAFRVSGDEEVGGGSELCNGKFRGHWGNKFIRWAEERGLSIVKGCTDVNRPALRWEVAQVLLETAADGPVGFSDAQCFDDVKRTDQPVNSVVCRAREAGVMKGTDGKANAYGKVNRAEAATMVLQAAKKLFGVSFEEREEQRPSGDEDGPSYRDEGFDVDKEAARGGVTRCWWDDQCTDLMSAQLTTEEECKAAGGESWGPDEDNCKDI